MKIYEEIRKALESDARIISAYVLGSFLGKSSKKTDDFDLAIITDSKKLDYKEAYKLVANIKFPHDLDLSVVNKSSSPLFLFQIVKKGKLIYSRDKRESQQFETYALTNYYDTQHLRNIYNSYLPNKFNLV